jgi:ABC-type xylose transport system permease subunit
VQRKLGDNLGSLRNSVWGFMLLIALVLVVWLVKRAPARLDALREAVPAARSGLVGFAILAVLGYALNDSGIAIPGVMLVILLTSVIWLLTRFEPRSSARSSAKKRSSSRPRVTTS